MSPDRIQDAISAALATSQEASKNQAVAQDASAAAEAVDRAIDVALDVLNEIVASGSLAPDKDQAGQQQAQPLLSSSTQGLSMSGGAAAPQPPPPTLVVEVELEEESQAVAESVLDVVALGASTGEVSVGSDALSLAAALASEIATSIEGVVKPKDDVTTLTSVSVSTAGVALTVLRGNGPPHTAPIADEDGNQASPAPPPALVEIPMRVEGGEGGATEAVVSLAPEVLSRGGGVGITYLADDPYASAVAPGAVDFFAGVI